MKNTVQSVKLSEPLKSVETPNKSLSHSKNANNAESGNAFQHMLNQQVQDRQQLERNAENKKLQEKGSDQVAAKQETVKADQPAQPQTKGRMGEHAPFIKGDMRTKSDVDDTKNVKQDLTNLKVKADPNKPMSGKHVLGEKATSPVPADDSIVDLKTAKIVDATQKDSVINKVSQAQVLEVTNPAHEPVDANHKPVIVDAQVRHAQTNKATSDAPVVVKKQVTQQAAIDTTVKADPKLSKTTNDVTAPKNTKSAPVESTTLTKQSPLTAKDKVAHNVSKVDLAHAAVKSEPKAPVAVEDALASKVTVKSAPNAPVAVEDALAPNVAAKAASVDSVAKATQNINVENNDIEMVKPKLAAAMPVTASAKQDPKAVVVANKVSGTFVEQPKPLKDAIAVDVKDKPADLKLTSKAANALNVTKQATAGVNVRQNSAQSKVDVADVTPPLSQAKSTTEEALLSPVDAMVKQASSAVVRKKSLEKVEMAKGLQAAGTEKELAEADEALMALKDGRIAVDNPRAAVRTTDFVQTLNQNVFNNQMKMRGDQPEAFKSFASIQGMSDVNGVNAQAISSLQASAPPSTLQAAANLMSSPLAGSNLINTPFSNRTGWNQAINQKVMYMVGNGEQTAKLTLNPPDLGPLQVVISVNNEKADTTFISANEDVRQALEDGLENLREKMGEAGVALGQANVNTGEQFAQQQQSTQKQTNNTPSNQSVAETEAIVNSTPVARNSNGLVDTFA